MSWQIQYIYWNFQTQHFMQLQQSVVTMMIHHNKRVSFYFLLACWPHRRIFGMMEYGLPVFDWVNKTVKDDGIDSFNSCVVYPWLWINIAVLHPISVSLLMIRDSSSGNQRINSDTVSIRDPDSGDGVRNSMKLAMIFDPRSKPVLVCFSLVERSYRQ